MVEHSVVKNSVKEVIKKTPPHFWGIFRLIDGDNRKKGK
jgi:hypothetical protein